MPNLYLIQAPERSSTLTLEELLGYQDMYDSAVVCANSKQEAKCIHPDDYYIFVKGRFVSKEGEYVAPSGYLFGWVHPKDVRVTFVGVAAKGMQPNTVICASYNAG